MARPKSIEDAALLAAARQVFAKAGAHGSTKEIARRAGISEAALFKRYRTVHALFRAAMMPPAVNAAEMIREASREREPHKCLLLIAEHVLDYFRSAAPLMSALTLHPLIGPDVLRKALGQDPVHELRQAIMFYLLGEARHERVSEASCEAAASLLVSSLHSIALLRASSKTRAPPKVDIASLVDALWQGLAPKQSKTSRSRRAVSSPGFFE